jgi:hypothetical protein
MSMNPNGVPSVRTTRNFAGGMQPRWGCFDLLPGSQGSSFLATLGQRPRKDEEKARSMHGYSERWDGLSALCFFNVSNPVRCPGLVCGRAFGPMHRPLALCIALWPWASPFGPGHRPLALGIALWPYASPFGPMHRPLALGIAALSKTPSAPHAACCLISSRSFSLDEIV